jgi:hypothetical protein
VSKGALRAASRGLVQSVAGLSVPLQILVCISPIRFCHVPQVLALPATAAFAVVLANAAPPTVLALAALAVVLANAAPPTVLALVALAVVLANAAPPTVLALAALAVVRAEPPLRIAPIAWGLDDDAPHGH